MVMTILEAQVMPEKAAILKATYDQATVQLDAGIAKTFLLQSAKDPGLWQILTLWESQEALDGMRQSGEIPRGILIFRAAGAEPHLFVFKVLSHAEI